MSAEHRIGLLTGASSGIGAAAAAALARTGMQLGLVCRTPEKARETVDRVRAETGNDALEPFAADFTELRQVRALASDVAQRLPGLDVLVNNAGCYRHSRSTTPDGHETVFGVNHLAPFLLTRLLLPLLRGNPPARIVNVASDAHFRGTIEFEDLDWSDRNYAWFKVYAQSKLGNVLTTRELARRLRSTDEAGIRVFAMHPGVVNTNLFRNRHPIDFFARIARRFFLDPDTSAAAIVRLAVDPAFDDLTGGYFDLDRPKRPSREARDDGVAERLWTVSERRVDLGADLF